MSRKMTINEAMDKVTKEYTDDGVIPYEINNGFCEEWANDVFAHLEKTEYSVEIWETPFGFANTQHAFLRIDGKFYDAECPQGVFDHMELPVFKKLFAEVNKRQPVWCIGANKSVKGENKRDMSDKMVAEYRKENGITW